MRIVFDLDGTLADDRHRLHYIVGGHRDYVAYYAACSADAPLYSVMEVFAMHGCAGHDIEIWTGRSDVVRRETEEWLTRFAIAPRYLTRMRPAGDCRPAEELKRAWLGEARANGTQPDLVYEDRDQVVAMWRAEGITCFQVACTVNPLHEKEDGESSWK